MKNRLLVVLGILAAACAVSGCGRAVSAAQDRAAAGPATAERTAVRYAQGKLKTGERELAQELAAQEQKLADTQAQGRYKVAMARCAALGGETRRSCAEAADADYEIAEAKAQLARAQADPDP